MKLKKLFGPSTLVAAAFIGPGTVTLCTLAGSVSGYNLLWALVFSILTTIVLQEMAARLGLITQSGLGEVIRRHQPPSVSKMALTAIIFSAIVIGNAAYEAGNISGAVLGLDLLVSGFRAWPVVLGGIAGVLLYIGSYRWIERFLIGLVLLMSLCFLLTVFLVQPNLTALLRGLIPSSFSPQELWLVLGLIGTTVVPYNLFLHAATVKEKWNDPTDLPWLRKENRVAVGLGRFDLLLHNHHGRHNATPFWGRGE